MSIDDRIHDATLGRVDQNEWCCRPGYWSAGEGRRSKSRSKRKRDRRRAEATAPSPKIKGGWGHGLPVSNSDLLLVRRAIRDKWPVSQCVRDLVVEDVTHVALGEANLSSSRLISAVTVLISMEEADQIAELREQGRKLLRVRRRRVRRRPGASPAP